MRAPVLAAIILILAAAGAVAQEATRLEPQRLLLGVALDPGSGFTADDALMIERSLHQRLREAQPDLVEEEVASGGAATPEALEASAKKEGADGWMLATVGGDWTSARVHVRAQDLESGAAVAEVSLQRSTWGSPGGLSLETWPEVTQAIAGKFPMREIAAAPSAGPQSARLTIRAMPGSLITGLGPRAIRIGGEGSAFRDLPRDREYRFRTELAGYLPVTQRVFLSADREVTVSQKTSPRLALEGSLADSRALGVDFTMQDPRHGAFMRFGFSTYAIGLALDSNGILLNDPLTNVVLQYGAYLSPEDRFFRFYLAMAGFIRVVHASREALFFDPVAPVGLRAVIGAESPLSERARLYLEYTPTVYRTFLPDELRASLGTDKATGWVFGSTAALNVLSFRVGVRWQL